MDRNKLVTSSIAENIVYLNFRYLVEETRDLEGAEFGSLYCGLFRLFATEYSLA
jgi:hypothetical protein